eukprot:CAMPEP_0195512270 /NCGR_PEP_ID=MMETSP0794_2-20130614/4282_1 /TAXON_ID=515487 /ORGANISM="Stephanopyxis turris, Strain CCMP 815" /LENGTH=519 /DNA_ID=CAMNT_0040640011 /DNA_START=200 /DNA_END=1759 /DNA_ORIENTATION=+
MKFKEVHEMLQPEGHAPTPTQDLLGFDFGAEPAVAPTTAHAGNQQAASEDSLLTLGFAMTPANTAAPPQQSASVNMMGMMTASADAGQVNGNRAVTAANSADPMGSNTQTISTSAATHAGHQRQTIQPTPQDVSVSENNLLALGFTPPPANTGASPNVSGAFNMVDMMNASVDVSQAKQVPASNSVAPVSQMAPAFGAAGQKGNLGLSDPKGGNTQQRGSITSLQQNTPQRPALQTNISQPQTQVNPAMYKYGLPPQQTSSQQPQQLNAAGGPMNANHVQSMNNSQNVTMGIQQQQHHRGSSRQIQPGQQQQGPTSTFSNVTQTQPTMRRHSQPVMNVPQQPQQLAIMGQKSVMQGHQHQHQHQQGMMQGQTSIMQGNRQPMMQGNQKPVMQQQVQHASSMQGHLQGGGMQAQQQAQMMQWQSQRTDGSQPNIMAPQGQIQSSHNQYSSNAISKHPGSQAAPNTSATASHLQQHPVQQQGQALAQHRNNGLPTQPTRMARNTLSPQPNPFDVFDPMGKC